MDKIIYNISSFNRKNELLRTIDSIYNQCDLINVFLNSYDEIPEELLKKKIKIYLSDNEFGDAYKFFNLSKSNGYFFTIDDDLIYPDNYTDFMISKVEEYNRKSIITLHSRNFNSFPIDEYYSKNVKVYHFKNENDKDVKVQFGGTGVMCFHTDLLKLPIEYFNRPNMADVWIGKFAKENDIDIICVKHNSKFVLQQPIEESIYTNSSKNNKEQTILANDSYLDKKISIVIPTFNNVEFINETLDSIINSLGETPAEILVGIDNCEKTLDFIKENYYDVRIKFFYFSKNIGPYIIKNTLANISKSDVLLFFDSDDIMSDTMIDDILSIIGKYDYCKPMMLNFNHGKNYLSYNVKTTKKYGEGVFAIKRNVFLYLNGFEPWRCAADSDFMIRLQKNRYKLKLTERISMYRRIHSNSITVTPQTSYSSNLRAECIKLTNSKTDFGPIEKLTIDNFTRIYTNVTINNISKRETIVLEEEVENNMKALQTVNTSNSSVTVNSVKVNEDKPKEIIKKEEVKEVIDVPVDSGTDDIRSNILRLLSSNTNVNKSTSKEVINKQREIINPIPTIPTKKLKKEPIDRTNIIKFQKGIGFDL
jgi:glycosyltransferase involved in cell wall biosynthesis